MGKWRIASFAVVLLAALSLAACKKKIPAPEPMGESAPVFAEGGDLKSFIVGKWCPATGIDPEKAEKFGVDPGSEIDVSEYWEIAADGTFLYTHTGSKDKVHGTWEIYQNGVVLTYKMWNDETLQDHRQRVAKEAEGGGSSAVAEDLALDNTYKMFESMDYLVVSEDMKGLMFTDPSAGSGGGGGMFSLVMDTPLARMK